MSGLSQMFVDSMVSPVENFQNIYIEKLSLYLEQRGHTLGDDGYKELIPIDFELFTLETKIQILNICLEKGIDISDCILYQENVQTIYDEQSEDEQEVIYNLM